jgi:hypothetical protein
MRCGEMKLGGPLRCAERSLDKGEPFVRAELRRQLFGARRLGLKCDDPGAEPEKQLGAIPDVCAHVEYQVAGPHELAVESERLLVGRALCPPM